MATDNKTINGSVDIDDDPTSELEAVTFRPDEPFGEKLERESDADTFDFADMAERAVDGGETVSRLRSDLQSRAKTIQRLQFDIEQLRSKWLGLEAEIKARETVTEKLNGEIKAYRADLQRKDELIKKRSASIKALKAEIRQRDELQRDAITALQEELAAARLEPPAPQEPLPISSENPAENELLMRLNRSQEYADTLRRKLQDLMAEHDATRGERDTLARDLENSQGREKQRAEALAAANEQIARLTVEAQSTEARHEDEMRLLRFELGEAQDTVVQTETLNGQLASDLIDTRNFKAELERMLNQSEEQAQDRIQKLEHQLKTARTTIQDMEQKLDAKSEAINVLLAELTKRQEQLDSIGEIGDVIQDIDVRISEQFDDATPGAPQTAGGVERDRVTRVLVGKIDQQLVRFPLFKDRLTIGRTGNNDIQLNAAYISRRHAVVLTEGDTTRVIDWGSKNGVFVNGKRITEHFLASGDIVAIGNAKFRYEERPKRPT